MRLDFSSLPLKNRAFSDKPVTFIDEAPKSFLTRIINLAAIETGDRKARERWQQRQLENLLIHCAKRSPIWKKRIGTRHIGGIRLSDLPIQGRADVIVQVEAEGSLMLPSDGMLTKKHSTSGSTGVPVYFFMTEHNSNYNSARSAAQYFMEGRDLSLNRTRTKSNVMSNKLGFAVKKSATWLDPLESFIRTGIGKRIEYFHPQLDALRREFERDKIGYLVVQPRFLEAMVGHFGPDFFSRAGTAMVISLSEALPSELRQMFDALGIAIRGNYSSEEVGMIAAECEKVSGMFHVSTSNVIVEVVDEEDIRIEGRRAGRVLVTHLHSYATPFIRYDLGDIASLDAHCPCGHDGPVISNIFGRAKAMLRHADGRLSMFYIRGKEMAAIAQFDEYRIRQTGLNTLVVEIGGRDSLSGNEIDSFKKLVQLHAGSEFDVQVKPVAAIDWGAGIKKLGFRNEIL